MTTDANTQQSNGISRRRVLRTGGIALAGAVGTSGCLSGGDGGGSGQSDGSDGGGSTATTDAATEEPSTSFSGTPAPGAYEDHPAVEAIAAQPYFGPPPGTGQGTIVAFEDPSCPRCAEFERTTVSEIRSGLAAEGTATFVYRGYPVVYPWGEPASRALEATFARDEAAFWSLADHYYGRQGSFSTDNVLEKTETFLADTTDVDGAAVVADVQNRAHDDAVQTDLDAGEAAGATATPTVFLFREGQFRTKATGGIGIDAIESVIEG